MERSSFFNAELKGEEYDRVYLAEDYARYFASFIGNGVFPTPSTNLQAVADGTTMNLTLKQGKAWINGYFYENTEDLTLSVDVADGVLNRIDRVVLRLDFINREIKAYVKKGEFASSPVAPALQRDMDMYELGIVDIKINKGVTKLVQADITDLRQNNNYCGLVSGVVQQIDTTNLFTQFQSSFDIWFEHIKGQLSEDQAGNLQLQIDTWNDFKANGGEIGGDLELIKNGITSHFGYSSFTPVCSSWSVKGGVIESPVGVNLAVKPGQWSALVPFIDNDLSLGNVYYKFKDIFVGSFLREINGFTKLSNGLILQWCNFTVPATSEAIAILPFAFPNLILSAIITPKGRATGGSVTWLDKTSVKIWNGSSESVGFYIWSIGY